MSGRINYGDVNVIENLNKEDEPNGKQFQLILEQKISDMCHYGEMTIRKFPRRERGLGDRIYSTQLTMFTLAVELSHKKYRKKCIEELDIQNHVLQALIRFGSNQDYFKERVPKRDSAGKKVLDEDGNVIYVQVAPPISTKQYEYWSKLLVEIGRLIGGFSKYIYAEEEQFKKHK